MDFPWLFCVFSHGYFPFSTCSFEKKNIKLYILSPYSPRYVFFPKKKVVPVISHKKTNRTPEIGRAKVLVVTCRRSCPPNESTDRDSQPTFEGGPGGPAVPLMGRVFCRWWKNVRGWYMLTRYTLYIYIYIYYASKIKWYKEIFSQRTT